MAKEDILRMYDNSITFAESEVVRLREELDEILDYLGNVRKKKWKLENG